MNTIDDIAAGLLAVAGMGRDAVGPAASAPPVAQGSPAGGRLHCLVREATRRPMPLHRDVPPPLLGAARTAAGATVDDAAGQAGAAAEDHGDVRDGD